MKLADEHFRLLVESIQDYAIYLLDPTGIVLSWNAGGERLKGYSASEIIGRPFSTFFTKSDQATGKPRQLLAMALVEGRHEDNGWRVRKDGTQFWANALITALFENGKHVGFAKVTRDVTDRAYRTFIEATHSIVWTADAHGHPNADSPTWRDFTGQSAAEWQGGQMWEALHPDDVARVQELWAAARASGTPLDAEFRLRRGDGTYVWMAARAVAFRNPDGTVREWFGVNHDISDRKRAELERERAFDLLRTTLRSIGDAVIATDARGNINFMNVVAESLTRWTTDEARGRPLREVFEIYNEETGARVQDPVDKVLQRGAVVGLANHTVLRRRDGSQIPIDDSAAPIRSESGVLEGVILVFRDASNEKRSMYRRLFLARATEEIAAASDYRDALRRIAKVACPKMADWVSVNVVEPTSGMLQQLAIAHEDPDRAQIVEELASRYPPDPAAAIGAPNVIRTGRSELYADIPTELLEASARDPEHLRMLRELDVRSAMIVPLRGQRDTYGAITFLFRGDGRRYGEEDVHLAEELSQRVSLLVERRRLEEQAELANRMKDEFLATISHELRTPLQAIIGYGSMLERKVAPDPDRAIAVMMKNAQAQARLIEDMLDMSRILSGKLRLQMSHVALASAITAAVDAMRPAAIARSLRLAVDVADDLGFVIGDFERLQQIVWNLLSNAVKFTPRGGSITLTARRLGSDVRVTVSDTGKGIDTRHLPVIFERFRQIDSSTTRSQSGLGLGLAIVKYLVEAHGGKVSADSLGIDQGATFTVVLPAHVDALNTGPALPASRTSDPAAALAGVRVLVVDDDEDTRQSIADTLASVGAIVELAGSSSEGLQRLEHERPHVLISDIGMPNEDGYTFLRRVRGLPRDQGGDIPAIALTAYTRREDVAKAAESGFQVHLSKPVELGDLIRAIKRCVRG
jgi:PAS domain S-box-containing protein